MHELWAKARNWKIQIIAVMGFLFAIYLAFSNKTPPREEPIVSPAVSQYEDNISGIGIVEPSSELIEISTEISGVVRDIHVAVGSKVKKGDALFTLDDREAKALLTKFEASLDVAKANAQNSKAAFELVSGIDDVRAIAKDDYNKRKYAYEIANASERETKAQLEQARIQLERLTVKAPIDGKILKINIHPGEFALAGKLESPLMVMGDTSTLNVRVEIDEESAQLIRPEALAKGIRRGVTSDALSLKFVRFEPLIRPKQNLAVAGQRVDTRVLQVIYAIDEKNHRTFVGEEMVVYIDANEEK